MNRLVIVLSIFLASTTTFAMVGGAPPEAEGATRHTVMILGSAGTFCTGTAIARDLVLTAAHCVLPGAIYKFVDVAGGKLVASQDVAKVVAHPQFDLKSFTANRATADLALLKFAQPLPDTIIPAALVGPRPRVAVGEAFVVLGYGVAVRGDTKTGGTLRRADLVATGVPGNLQLRLVDAATRGERPGIGACTGDSGGPVFQESNGQRLLLGVISWSTGPRLAPGCGGLTGITPIELYPGWIVETARKLNSPLP
jgi:secreted trypsin-like serine protease